MSTRIIALGTYEYPLIRLSKAFVEIFNYYDDYPKANITLNLMKGSRASSSINYKSESLLFFDKNITMIAYSPTISTSKFRINITDKSKVNLVIIIFHRL